MLAGKDIVFANANGTELKLDIVVPDKPNGIAILFVHGGGWRMGTRDMMAPIAQEMARYGFTGVISQYRLNAPPQAVWPAHIHDVKARSAGCAKTPATLASMRNASCFGAPPPGRIWCCSPVERRTIPGWKAKSASQACRRRSRQWSRCTRRPVFMPERRAANTPRPWRR